MTKHKPYKKRTDLEKIQSQWHKLSGLHSREEWSAAVVRAATTAEIAANYAIRKEFKSRSKLRSKFVNNLLRWANGLTGKFDRLLIPISGGGSKHKAIKKLKQIADRINNKRNAIVHQGEFCSEQEATAIIKQTKKFVVELVRIYKASFTLK